MKQTRCVVIGGGTGSFAVLNGLKHQVSDLAALVSMADDGGSTGLLRDELGVLPPGDVRQCLVALSDTSDEVRDLFNFRFEEGSLAGHSFGNLFLSAVEKMTNNFGDAVRMAGDILNIKGRVIPITLEDVRLAIKWADGTVVQGQGQIDITHFVAAKGAPELYLEPKGSINPEADVAIREADVIIVAPGDIYTSLGPLLIIDGVAEALAATKATVVYVCNLMVKPGHTKGFTVADHAAEIERFAGGPILDYVLYNTGKPDEQLFEKYARTGEVLVQPDLEEFKHVSYKAIGYDLIAKKIVAPPNADALAFRRTYIRHDGTAIAKAIKDIL